MAAGPWIIAHRGDCTNAAANTLAAFEAAAMNGADMVEFDVRRLADGTLVVHHDPDIQNQLLSTLDFHAFHEIALTIGARPPTLAEALALCGGRIQVDVELKDPFCEDEVLRAFFQARFSARDFLVSSFDSSILKNLRDLRPGIRTGLIRESAPFDQVAQELMGVEGDYLIPEFSLLDDDALTRSARTGIRLLPWAVNRRDELQRLLRAEAVAGIITDRPTTALRLRRASRSGSI